MYKHVNAIFVLAFLTRARPGDLKYGGHLYPGYIRDVIYIHFHKTSMKARECKGRITAREYIGKEKDDNGDILVTRERDTSI